MKWGVLVAISFPYKRIFNLEGDTYLALEITMRESDPEHSTRTGWRASIALVGVLSPFVSLFFLSKYGSCSHFNLMQEKKKVSLALPSTCLPFQWCISCICTEQKQGTPLESVSQPQSWNWWRLFFSPPTLFDSHSYKVKGKLASVLSCFRFLHLRFSGPDVLKIMRGDLTPIFPRLWNPSRLNYEHNSATFFLRLLEKHSLPPFPALLVQLYECLK